jgi:VWFA-related protein
LAPGAGSRAQERLPGARAELVQLDVVVTDGDGQPVRGLTRDDFEVFEDKKAQRLTNFVFVEGRLRASRAGAASVPEPAPPVAAPAADAERPMGPGRHLVIVIDDLHIAPGNLEFVKGALRRLVDGFLGPDDFAALLTTSAPAGVRQLSRDAATIRQQITQLGFRQAPSPPAAGTDMTPAQAELILRGDWAARRLAGRRLLDEPGSVLSATSPRAATEQGASAVAAAGGTVGGTSEGQETVAEREAERQARAVLNDALRDSAATLRAIEEVLRSLAPLPGRKLCLLVSDGFLVGTGTSEERTHDLRAIVDAATRSGAVVYAVDSRGLQGSLADASVAGTAAPAGVQSSVDRQSSQLYRTTLETLSADTGGFLISGTNAFDGGLQRMLAENDSYYLMAYQPSNRKRDGKFRRIDVKLPRHARYVARTRRGYLAPDDSQPGPRSAALMTTEARGTSEAEARTILDAARGAARLPVHVAADYVELPPAGPLALVRAHVDVAALAVESGEAGQLAVDIVGGVYDPGGQPIGPVFGRRTQIRAADVARARRDGVQWLQRLALPPGRYEIRLAARAGSPAQLGGDSQWVEIPDLEDGALALSGLFLSRGAPEAQDRPGGAGAPEELRDVQALRRFGSRDQLYFQIYVYNLRGADEGGADAVLQAQLRQADKLVAASQPQPIRLQRKDGVLLPQTNGMPLEGLPPGRYELRVVVVDKQAGATVSRQVDFSIE